MNSVMMIAGAACLALLWVESGIPHGIKRLLWRRNAYKHRLKPLDCVVCMSWWLGLLLNYFRNNYHLTIYTIVETVMAGAIASVLAVLIHKHLNT
jgi:hypothetical protein